MEKIAPSFQKDLWEARRKNKLTLRKLGEIVGMTPSYISEIEQGRRLPMKSDVKSLKKALKIISRMEEILKEKRKYNQQQIKEICFRFQGWDNNIERNFGWKGK